RPEYNFENKFRALIGKTATTVLKEVEDNFPHLPLGCSIVLEQKAKQYILSNINAATSMNSQQLILKIKSFPHETNLVLNLKNFIEFQNVPLQIIYERGGWKRLCHSAGILEDFDSLYEKEIINAISQKWLSSNSRSYFQFILDLANKEFDVSYSAYSEVERKMLLMLYYDIWREEGRFGTLDGSIKEIGKNKILVKEIIEVLEILIDRIDFKEMDIDLPYDQPLKVHARYTRDQILVAMGLSKFEKVWPSREGVVLNKETNTELLFINLIKSEENFSPTTMYEDYAINEVLFHWQSQNSVGPLTKKGISYIKHRALNKRILLFIRERNKDEFGNTMGFVFVGEGKLDEHYGSKPMSIKWELLEPLPHYLWKDAAKLRTG
ncbi:MAG TPA: DUF3427 domain-containing protein, partial [Bacteroidetes bacterium]|nr:DUF3427 domain-containing protein [Bacteroidota bacterium]